MKSVVVQTCCLVAKYTVEPKAGGHHSLCLCLCFVVHKGDMDRKSAAASSEPSPRTAELAVQSVSDHQLYVSTSQSPAVQLGLVVMDRTL